MQLAAAAPRRERSLARARPSHAAALAAAAPLAPPLLAFRAPLPASAASVTYDFGYRLERALDEDKRGPAEDLDGSEALLRMCSPTAVDSNAAEEIAGKAVEGADAAASAATSSGALAGAAAAVAVPPTDPASAMTWSSFGVVSNTCGFETCECMPFVLVSCTILWFLIKGLLSHSHMQNAKNFRRC